MRFRLGDEDRQNLGCPEWIEFDDRKLKISEIRKIRDVTNVKQADWGDELEAGNVDLIAAFVWIALRRIGVEIPYDELDFDLGATEMDNEGKAPAPTTTRTT